MRYLIDRKHIAVIEWTDSNYGINAGRWFIDVDLGRYSISVCL